MRIVLAFAFAVSIGAQEAQFDVHSRLVLVPTIVTDSKGRFIDGLQASDFVVLDNGKPQKAGVDTLDTGVAPIALVVAVQSSGISAAVLEKVRKIGSMIQPLITGDRGCAGLVSFDDTVTWLQDCTKDQDKLSQAFEKLRAGAEKSACMLDAVRDAIQRLRKRPDARRVVLLISESRDRGSKVDLENVVVEAQSSDVALYAATYSAFKTAWTSKSSATALPKPPKRPSKPSEEVGGTITGGPANERTNPRLPPPEQRVDILGGIGELSRLGKTNDAEALTKATGGATLAFTRQKALEEAIEKIGAELHAQYVLSFSPESPTPGYHRLEVRVARRDAHVRARPGYWGMR